MNWKQIEQGWKQLRPIVFASVALGLYLQYVNLSSQVTVVTLVVTSMVAILWKALPDLEKVKSQNQELGERLATIERALSYKFEITVVPDWKKIAEFIANRDGTAPEAVTAEVRGQQEAGKIPRLSESYRFVIFCDGNSGSEAIWSDSARTFVREPEVSVRLAEWSFGHSDDRLIRHNLLIAPGRVGFNTEMGIVMKEDLIGAIPVHAVRRLLVEMSEHHRGSEQYAFKNFPRSLQKMFDDLSVTYNLPSEKDDHNSEVLLDADGEPLDGPYINKTDWAKKLGLEVTYRTVRSHCFSTVGYDVYLSLEPFERDKYNFMGLYGLK